MVTPNIYSKYKKDTNNLLYWLINTSNGIVKSGINEEGSAAVTINTTGQCTADDLVRMSRLIAKNLKPIPSYIFGIFQDIIKARTKVHTSF
jgi:hypothetical protein